MATFVAVELRKSVDEIQRCRVSVLVAVAHTKYASSLDVFTIGYRHTGAQAKIERTLGAQSWHNQILSTSSYFRLIFQLSTKTLLE